MNIFGLRIQPLLDNDKSLEISWSSGRIAFIFSNWNDVSAHSLGIRIFWARWDKHKYAAFKGKAA